MFADSAGSNITLEMKDVRGQPKCHITFFGVIFV